MKTNVSKPVYTHEGTLSTKLKPIDALRRSVMACMLWEDNYYEDGQSIVDRISALCKEVPLINILDLAKDAHQKGYLRHVPLKLIVEALKKKEHFEFNKKLIADTIETVCSRPDQMTELLSLYWKDGKKPLAAQLKKGLAKAFLKFDAYQLAKYNRDEPIKLRDVLFLCHAKPQSDTQADIWKMLINGTLPSPDTWEVKLSAGQDKKQSFEELLKEGKMGKLAILRNLRNMADTGIDKDLVASELMKKSRPMLPFQFVAAAKACPQWEDIIDSSMVQALQGKDKLKGKTVVFVDVSGSMSQGIISKKSTITPMEAACSLAILLREVCEKVDVWTFSDALVIIPPRTGMALKDSIITSQSHGSTYLGKALQTWQANKQCHNGKADRIIIITDEQAHDIPPKMEAEKCYVLNISCMQNGIRNNGQWLTISGFSEACIDYIKEIENLCKSGD